MLGPRRVDMTPPRCSEHAFRGWVDLACVGAYELPPTAVDAASRAGVLPSAALLLCSEVVRNPTAVVAWVDVLSDRTDC